MARYAVGDIHGCCKTFKKLVQTLALKKEDQLYLLGDLVNKGPDSKGVLDYIFELKKEGYKIISVRGNHDQMLINAWHGKDSSFWRSEHGKVLTLVSFGVKEASEIPEAYILYLKKLPFYLELDRFFLVHAGLNYDLADPFTDLKSMISIRKYVNHPERIGNKILIHGHVPTPFSKISNMEKKEINLDTGCVYYKNEQLGLLTSLNLETMEFICEKNVDQPYMIELK